MSAADPAASASLRRRLAALRACGGTTDDENWFEVDRGGGWAPPPSTSMIALSGRWDARSADLADNLPYLGRVVNRARLADVAIVRRYGSWSSPISAASLATSGVRLAEASVDGDDVYWLEGRPAEAGRQAVVRLQPDGTIGDATGRDFNVRTLVHEYGGGSYVVSDGVVWFSNFGDQRVWRSDAEAITADPPIERGARYADYRLSPDSKTLYAVRETHSGGEASNDIVRDLGRRKRRDRRRRRRARLLQRTDPTPRWAHAWVCPLGPPSHAMAVLRAGRRRPRHRSRRGDSRRPGRVRATAGGQPSRRLVVRHRPIRLVEPVNGPRRRARRGGRSTGCPTGSSAARSTDSSATDAPLRCGSRTGSTS